MLALSYVLVGWQLAINDILIFLAVSGTVFAITLASNENPWIGGILGNLPQILLFALSTSILITLITTVPVVLMVIIVPALTTFLSWKELQLLQVDPNHARRTQLMIIGCSLLVGELLDLFVVSSPKN
ncbi:MAG: hypothetical protein MUF72_08920 [Elainella sp. Prado103]|nr:hypothetical protein [Elainella sp. Prado103]